MNTELSEEKSLARTKELLLKWKNDKNIHKLQEFYDTKSFSGILGVDRREMSHSKFLSWIFNDSESHNLGQFAIKQLLDLLIEYGEEKIVSSLEIYNDKNKTNFEFDHLYKVMILDIYTIKNLKVNVEKQLTGGRIDIIISMNIESKNDDVKIPEKLNIIIENKVDSSEHSKQTSTYYDYYTQNEIYKNDLNVFVFLLPVSTSMLKEQLADCEHFININYQLIADNILERVLEQDISDRTNFIVSEYLLSLKKPSESNKGQTMMTGSLEKELLQEFWQIHSELLNTAFGVLSEVAIEEGDYEQAKIFKNMQNSANELTRYNDIEEYLKQTKKTLPNDLKLISINLINEIKKTIPKAEITYAPSKINIKNLNSKTKGKVFLYITIQNEKIIFSFVKDEAFSRLSEKYEEGNEHQRRGKDKVNFEIELNKENNFNFKKYIELIKEEYERLEN